MRKLFLLLYCNLISYTVIIFPLFSLYWNIAPNILVTLGGEGWGSGGGGGWIIWHWFTCTKRDNPCSSYHISVISAHSHNNASYRTLCFKYCVYIYINNYYIMIVTIRSFDYHTNPKTLNNQNQSIFSEFYFLNTCCLPA